ncbi:hypothetical protein IW262DRAFT_1411050 [Armillaria fumosa]|nr:hypothetical protein IW262DRAFT_1411050 [Armillaria fumosa]
MSEPDPNDIYFPGVSYPLYTVKIPDFPEPCSVKGQTAYMHCASLIAYIFRLHLFGPVHYLLLLSSPSFMKYFRDSYSSSPPRCMVYCEGNESSRETPVSPCIHRCLGLYAITLPEQEGRTVDVLLLEHVTGKDLRYLAMPYFPPLSVGHG